MSFSPGIGPRITKSMQSVGINGWRPTALQGKKGYFEGMNVQGGQVIPTGVIVSRDGLVYRGRQKFHPNTFFFRGEPVKYSEIAGGKPTEPVALELTQNDPHSSRVLLDVYPIGQAPHKTHNDFNEVLGPDNNPLFNLEYPAKFDEEIQGAMSFTNDILPLDVLEIWNKFDELSHQQNFGLDHAFGWPSINIKIGRGFELASINDPDRHNVVKNIKFLFGQRFNGMFVGQMVFEG